MTEPPYNRGGILPPGPLLIRLDPRECLINDRGDCLRGDHDHAGDLRPLPPEGPR